MSTRRPKVPQARTAGGGSAAGAGASVRGGAQPARPRVDADPDTISATRSADETAAKPAGGGTAATTKPSTVKSSGKSSGKAAAKPTGKSAAVKSGAASAAAKLSAKPATKAGDVKTTAKKSTTKKITAKTAGKPAAAQPDDIPEDDLRPVPAKAFSGRLLVLAMVTAVITVLLAPSVSTYLHQRSDIAALEADIAAEQQSAEELQTQLDRWSDPSYIKQQARERIFLVMPGETRYLVKGEHGVENAEQQAQAEEEDSDLQWVDALWESVERSASAP